MKIKQKKSAASFKDLSTDGIVLLKTKHSFEPRNCVTVTLELHNFIAGSPKRETVLFCLNCSTCVCVCVAQGTFDSACVMKEEAVTVSAAPPSCSPCSSACADLARLLLTWCVGPARHGIAAPLQQVCI